MKWGVGGGWVGGGRVGRKDGEQHVEKLSYIPSSNICTRYCNLIICKSQ